MTHADSKLVDITYYTDPLCCWSWAMNEQWNCLKKTYADQITYRYRMAGLLPDWKHFQDNVHHVSRPAQMGPVWMEASHLTQTAIRSTIWIHDPPRSSYLACIAVKCAELQSMSAAEIYLQMLWRNVMQSGVNISTETALLQIASELCDSYSGILDLTTFCDDLRNGRGLEAFRKDLTEVQQLQIMRFPTLLMRKPGCTPIMIAGYKRFSVLNDAILHLINKPVTSSRPAP